jgi:hypothetical protein
MMQFLSSNPIGNMIKILIGLFTLYLQFVSANNEIGIRSKVTSEYQALKTVSVISRSALYQLKPKIWIL